MLTRTRLVIFVLGAFACADFLPVGADVGATCAALFRGKHCQFEKSAPGCLKRGFSGTWLTLHVHGTHGVDGSRARSDPWLKSFRNQVVNETQELLRVLPRSDALNFTVALNGRRMGYLPSCALVGSGSELSGSNLGSIIDKHDVVVRLNRAPVKGFERDVGSFTTLRYTNNFNEGYREYDTEAVVASKWCSSGPPCDFYGTLRRLGGKKVHALNPAFVAYARRDTFAADVGHNPSSGFTATLLLLHICSSVDIYGFSVFHDDPRMKRWYYNHDRRTSPHSDVRGVTRSHADPLKRPLRREGTPYSRKSAWHAHSKVTIHGKAEALQYQSHVWPTYDKLWWNVSHWVHVIPNSDAHKPLVASQSSGFDRDFKNSVLTSTEGSHVGRSRNLLAQTLFLGHEKGCLRSLHMYGLISATDGLTQ